MQSARPFIQVVSDEYGGQMSSTITRAKIRSLIIDIIRADLAGSTPVREISRLGEDLGISSDRRAGYLPLIKESIERLGYSVKSLDEQDLRSANRVTDLVNMVWSTIQPGNSELRHAS